MKPKCNLTEEERRRILPKIERWITDDEESELLAHFPQYLFYWYGNGHRETYCSACGARNRGVTGKIRHGSTVGCQACGRDLRAAAVNRYGYGMKKLRTWGKAAFIRTDEEGNLLILSASILHYFLHNNLRGEIELETKALYYMAPEKVQMWRMHNYWEAGYWRTIPEPAKTVSEGFANGWSYGCIPADGSYLTIGIEKLERSNFRYCAVEEYFARRGEQIGEDTCRGVISYLAQYAMRPQLEMITKLGLTTAAAQLVNEGRMHRQYLNWKAKTPAEFLKMPKRDAKLFLSAGMDLRELILYRQRWPDLPMETYVEFRKDFRNEKEAKLLIDAAEMSGVGIKKAWRYTERFPKNLREGYLREWVDYLDMAHRLGLDLNEETVAMPRDLHTRHDEVAVQLKYRTSAEKEEAYRKRREKLRKKYEFTLGELSVLVPENLGEIISEGKTLHHCVGGYADRHADGKTCILFVRKTRTPGRSFLTMELNEKSLEIIQIHGYKNERYRRAVSPRIRYQGLLDTWLSWVEQGSRRDDKGNPILPKGVQTA